ncbi:RNA 2',3'-cyclic phosphodiesterase [Deinococcus wulumuqiensis]|uniref:RNA 2',3'-cyclic phosphodiesterase n=1 Tax=Deinococcus wulumuqiensis TaxID=980427 RepID=A0AAV4K6N3_9DEIO|nr:RNA 2',3'-cyclic phosphodiesterase [Deinococcus wulumuqiensis]QII21563.1 RNA 2',3'-cyclic phosphodiesterase [Deinococcus wulumuqiensis R12]GGI83874.1 RNA 2',3'-cyclic phosphodiesterase [Deinococcus wulumuqiensis]GGP29715.1 RNA 2',3'-cyclic phosphodiesterase [Deinococcus wulumuqiensis]
MKKAESRGPRAEGQKAQAGARSARPPASGKQTNREEPHQPSTYRLFYALRVPAEIAAPLAQAQARLRGNWRAVRPDQMHVTLSYLPAVPPERVEDLKRLGTRLAQDVPPLDVRLRGTGYFPNEGSPRVWFVKTEAEGLTELAEGLRAGIRDLGVETDDLAFKAHITLARKKGPAPRLPPLIFDQGWTAPGLTLYRSILRKTGPIYEVQSTFRFRGPASGDLFESAPPAAPSAPQEQP